MRRLDQIDRSYQELIYRQEIQIFRHMAADRLVHQCPDQGSAIL